VVRYQRMMGGMIRGDVSAKQSVLFLAGSRNRAY
jgi:hypothetical protein